MAVTLTDFHIRLSRAAVQPGKIVFVVVNKGHVVHDIRFTGRGGSRRLQPGQHQRVTVKLPKAALYRYLCSVPGHAALGMKGTLRVGKVRAPAQPSPPMKPVITGDQVQLTLVANGLTGATDVTAPPGDTHRLVVVQQDGRVALIKDGAVQPTAFLDLRDRVRPDGEKGLLSIAFAPDYAASRLVYAFYNDLDGNIRIVSFRQSAETPDVIDASTEHLLLEIRKPTADHNGGMMQFGPDGSLYIGVGDGGADVPTVPIGVYGQTLDDLLGSILRIDPRGGDPYSIPSGNPVRVDAGARPEIVAYGLRNPWRFWIDPDTKSVLIGDVGEGSREEIDRLPLDQLGLDYGWPCEEGTVVPPEEIPRPASCAGAKLTPPLYEYAHEGSRCSVIGGVVSHDPRLPELRATYLFTDLCEGILYAINPAQAKPVAVTLGLTVKAPTSLGVDADGRIYLTTGGGQLYRLDPKSLN